MTNRPEITDSEREQIAEILKRRASDIASFMSEATRQYERLGSGITAKDAARVTAELPGSVEMALSREIARLRRLAEKVEPVKIPDDE